MLDIPLLKCFFVVDDPWWGENVPHLDMPNLPAHEVYYQKRDGKGLVMVYADRPYLNFWSQYLRKGYETRAEINGDQGMPQVFARFVGINPKRIVSYGVRHWGGLTARPVIYGSRASNPGRCRKRSLHFRWNAATSRTFIFAAKLFRITKVLSRVRYVRLTMWWVK